MRVVSSIDPNELLRRVLYATFSIAFGLTFARAIGDAIDGRWWRVASDAGMLALAVLAFEWLQRKGAKIDA